MNGSAVEEADIDLNRDVFMRRLLRALSGTLQDVVGLQEASGFISVVGSQIGDDINRAYCRAIQVEKLNRSQVPEVLVDLKRRIDGDFYIIEETNDRIVLGNRRCPFGDLVSNRPSLCMMTSNVFGSIAAQNLGYARVDIEKAIAKGDPECRVVVYLTASDDIEPGAREYFSEPG